VSFKHFQAQLAPQQRYLTDHNVLLANHLHSNLCIAAQSSNISTIEACSPARPIPHSHFQPFSSTFAIIVIPFLKHHTFCLSFFHLKPSQHNHILSQTLPDLSHTMPVTEKLSRHEQRRPSNLLTRSRYGSIFDLAKAAEVRRGSHDITDSALSSPTFATFSKSRNASLSHTLHMLPQSAAASNKKQRNQYLTPPTTHIIDFGSGRQGYESSNESFSPTTSEFSNDDNSDGWFSNVGTPYQTNEHERDYCSVKQLPAIMSEEEYERTMHRAAALAALEGRALSVAEDMWEPLIRTSRSEYEDHVEAEHGQLQCISPRPHRPASKIQKDITSWEDHLSKMPPPVFGLGISTDKKQLGGSDLDDWCLSDSPLDILNSRPVFYHQQEGPDDFWAEEHTLEQLSVESLASFSLGRAIAVEV